MSVGEGIYFQISGPDVYIEFSNQQGSAGADVDGVTTGGWGHVHTIYRDPANDNAVAVTQQESTGMGGPGAGPPRPPADPHPAPRPHDRARRPDHTQYATTEPVIRRATGGCGPGIGAAA